MIPASQVDQLADYGHLFDLGNYEDNDDLYVENPLYQDKRFNQIWVGKEVGHKLTISKEKRP